MLGNQPGATRYDKANIRAKNPISHVGTDVLVVVTFVCVSHVGGTCTPWSWSLADADVGELPDDGLQSTRAGVHLGRTVHSLRRGSFVACVPVLWNVPHFAQNAPDTDRNLRGRMGAHCALQFYGPGKIYGMVSRLRLLPQGHCSYWRAVGLER
jgi:hypothetical protein